MRALGGNASLYFGAGVPMDMRLTFNQDAERYESARPTYCRELFDAIIGYAALDATREAIEVGIGTGQATKPILDTGCSVTAIELGDRLAAYCADKYRSYPNFTVLHMPFESYTAPRKVDLLYAATSFHWIPEETAYPKAYDLLNSGGALALFWNRPSVEDPRLHEALQQAYARHTPHMKAPERSLDALCEKLHQTIMRYGFIDTRVRLFSGSRTLSAAAYLALLNTYSDHISLEPEIRQALFADIGQAIMAAGGRVTLRDDMDLYLGRKP